MFNTVTVKGAAGAIGWGYQPAGTLRNWTVTRIGGVWNLTATVDQVDSYRVSQRPLVFKAPHKDGSFRWPIVGELQIVDGALTARLGPPER